MTSGAEAGGSKPLVSVIMPCFNAAPRLEAALRSVAAQTWPNLELVFVDNNSTDGSVAIAQRFAAQAARLPVRVERSAEQGVNAARNHGYQYARGAFVQWLDADDELASDKIARQVAALRIDPTIDIAYSDYVEVRTEPKAYAGERRIVLPEAPDQIGRTLAGVWYPPHSYLIRRSAADRLQGLQAWRPGRPVATDVEYSAVAALAGLRFGRVPGAEARYHLWSRDQLGARTPYPLRVGSLRAIFSRLRALAADLQSPLSPRHRILLDQGWDIWRATPGSVQLRRWGAERAFARAKGASREIELPPREAALLQAILASGLMRTSWHFALMLTPRLSAFDGTHSAVVEAMQRLQAFDLLERVEVDIPQIEP